MALYRSEGLQETLKDFLAVKEKDPRFKPKSPNAKCSREFKNFKAYIINSSYWCALPLDLTKEMLLQSLDRFTHHWINMKVYFLIWLFFHFVLSDWLVGCHP
jgi:hypothetical protein